MLRIINVRGLKTREARQAVCYVGRPFAGWKGHPLANPFKPVTTRGNGVRRCLDLYRKWLAERPTLDADLAALWEECKHGSKPLGCLDCDWDGVSEPAPQCHAVILSQMLMDRFASVEVPADNRTTASGFPRVPTADELPPDGTGVEVLGQH